MDGLPGRQLQPRVRRRRPSSGRPTWRSTAATRSARTSATSDDYANNGYSRWPFFEYLAEKYGNAFVQDIFAQGACGRSVAHSQRSRRLWPRKGTTLADTYNAWTAGESHRRLQHLRAHRASRRPSTANLQTGAQGGNLGTFLVDVNHLSTRTIEFTRGDGDASHICYAATLTLTVAMPAGTLSKPVFWWDSAGQRARCRSRSTATPRPRPPVGHLHVRRDARLPVAAERLDGRRRGRLLGQGELSRSTRRRRRRRAVRPPPWERRRR